MNKANLAWVCSEGTPGHEIQSLTLAQNLCESHALFRFKVKPPWEWALPRLLPGLRHAIDPQVDLSDLSATPNFIISTGRRAAGIGRYARTQRFNPETPHIQILNPGHNFKKYSVLLLPEHDQINHSQVFTFRGNLHPFSRQWFSEQRQILSQVEKQTIALFIGQPAQAYFQNSFSKDLEHIRRAFPGSQITLCGSPRLNTETQAFIRGQVQAEDKLWLGEADGENPYRSLLVRAAKIFVTADSINMINESAASEAALTVLATDYAPSKKHRYFINSIRHRLCQTDAVINTQALADPVAELMANPVFLKRLKLT